LTDKTVVYSLMIGIRLLTSDYEQFSWDLTTYPFAGHSKC